jgi:hypothetical protein
MGTAKVTSWLKSSTGSDRVSPNTFSPRGPAPLPSSSDGYERADDSDGVIGDAIGEAVTDCGRAWAAVPECDPKSHGGLVRERLDHALTGT